MIVAGTGHRPERILLRDKNAYDEDVFGRLVALAQAALKKTSPDAVIAGGALGWDTALADAALSLDLPLFLYIPFEGQERRWPREAQSHYLHLRDHAARIVVCSPGGYTAAKLLRRNEAMVDDADALLALWDGEPRGGTYRTVQYAQEQEKPVWNLYPSWETYG